MKTIRRIISLFSILAIMLSVLSCGNNDSSDTPTDTAPPDGSMYPYDGRDLKGETFVFLNCPKDLWSMRNTIQPDEFNGETVNDASDILTVTDRLNGNVVICDIGGRAAPKLIRLLNFSGHPDIACHIDGGVVLPLGHQGLALVRLA